MYFVCVVDENKVQRDGQNANQAAFFILDGIKLLDCWGCTHPCKMRVIHHTTGLCHVVAKIAFEMSVTCAVTQ